MYYSTGVKALILLAAAVNSLPLSDNLASTYTPARRLDKLAEYLPHSALPAPEGQQLKYVVLGIGTQNYTCGSDENAAPGTTGAVGKLNGTN